MLASITIALSLVIAIIRGGQLNRLRDIRFRMPYLLIISLFLEFWPYRFFYTPFWISFIIFILKYSLLLAFIFINSSYKHLKIIGLGTALNFLVILLNGGAMPVSQRALQIPSLDKYTQMIQNGKLISYTFITDKTPLWFLADIIYLPWPKEQFISIGDIIILLGVFLLIQNITLAE